MTHDATRKLDLGSDGVQAFLRRFTVTLVIIDGGAEGTEFLIDKPRCVIGRADDSDWVLKDDAISKHHAAVEVTAKGIRLCDLGSTNGTFLNGEPVDTPRDLKHGDHLSVGDVQLQCLIEARTSSPKTFEIS